MPRGSRTATAVAEREPEVTPMPEITAGGQAVLPLVPEEAVTAVRESVPLSALPPDEELGSPPVSAAFLADFAVKQLYPVILVRRDQPGEDGVRFTVADGRQRVRAARQLEWGGIEALVYPEGWVNPAVITLGSNALRRDNPISDLEAIQALIAAGHDEAAIAAATKLAPQTIKKRLRLLTLDANLLNEFRAGRMAVGVAEELCKLTPAEQAEVWHRVHGERQAERQAARARGMEEEGGSLDFVLNRHVSLGDVRAVRQVGAAAAAADLQTDLFDLPAEAAPANGAVDHVAAHLAHDTEHGPVSDPFSDDPAPARVWWGYLAKERLEGILRLLPACTEVEHAEWETVTRFHQKVTTALRATERAITEREARLRNELAGEDL